MAMVLHDEDWHSLRGDSHTHSAGQRGKSPVAEGVVRVEGDSHWEVNLRIVGERSDQRDSAPVYTVADYPEALTLCDSDSLPVSDTSPRGDSRDHSLRSMHSVPDNHGRTHCAAAAVPVLEQEVAHILEWPAHCHSPSLQTLRAPFPSRHVAPAAAAAVVAVHYRAAPPI